MSFQDKVVLITGGSSGIGADAAKHFAKLGASVAIVGRNESRLNRVAVEIKTLSGRQPLAIIADVTKDDERIINETIGHFNRIDILINSVGIVEQGSLENLTFDSFDRVLDTNLRSIVKLTQLAVPHLEKTKGNIVNVSSYAGLRPLNQILAYSVSKAALDQFTKCVSLELASKGIRVNSINPGIIETPILRSTGSGLAEEDAYKRFIDEMKKSHPIGRVGTVEDTSAAIVFLANETSSFITGVLLPVDGGKVNLSVS